MSPNRGYLTFFLFINFDYFFMERKLDDVELSVFSVLCAEISVFHNITIDNDLQALNYDWQNLAQSLKTAITQFRNI